MPHGKKHRSGHELNEEVVHGEHEVAMRMPCGQVPGVVIVKPVHLLDGVHW